MAWKLAKKRGKLEGKETMTDQEIIPVKKIQIRQRNLPPYGFYHILKVWNEERGDLLAAAYVSTNYPEEAQLLAEALAKRHWCAVEDKHDPSPWVMRK